MSICFHYVKGTHWEFLDNCIFVSIMSWVLNGSVLTIIYSSPFCHGYSLKVSCQLSFCLHYVMGTDWSVLSILYLSPLCHGTHWGCLDDPLFVAITSSYSWSCLDNCLFVSIMSCVLIGGVLTMVYFSP